MKLTVRAARISVGAMVAAGSVLVAAPAHATTTPRGSTTLLSCDDVVWSAKFNDPITKTGLGFATRNLKVTSIIHPETAAPSALGKLETDPVATPDVGDTDSCSGTITTNTNPWTSAGAFAPYTPVQGTLPAPINEIISIAGALTGRGECDPNTTDPSTWALHGKLTIGFGNQPAVGTIKTLPMSATNPSLVTATNPLGLTKVSAQVYVTSAAKTVAPVDLNNDNDTADPGETATDLVDYTGVVIKGTGEGAFFDETTTNRSVKSQLFLAAEACFFNSDFALPLDGIIGAAPAGGLQQVVTDTDVDTDSFDNPVVGINPAYNNSIIFSI